VLERKEMRKRGTQEQKERRKGDERKRNWML